MSYEIEDIPFKKQEPTMEDLKEQVAFYKSELGLQIENTQIHALSKALDISPGCAYFIMALYNAKCRVMTWEQLLELIPSHHHEDDNRGPPLVAVYAKIARRVLGEHCIETAWGTGYKINITGKSRVLAILNPVDC